jgi:hypothetical protein
MKSKFLGFLALVPLCAAYSANAAVIVTLTPTGGGTAVNISGSGTTTGAIGTWIGEDGFQGTTNAGNYLNAPSTPTAFALTPALSLTGTSSILSLLLDDDNTPGDDFGLFLDVGIDAGTVFSLNAYATIAHAFSNFNLGTYAISGPGTTELGGVTLVIRNASVPEPGTLALLGLGLAGLGLSRRRKAN